jgi:hypothetical protein
MSSRERRLLDKDIEIRKLQGELKHYKTCFFSCVFEKDRTRKALDVAVDTLNYLRRTNPICYQMECIEKALEEITALEQKEHFADASKKIEQKD